MEQLTLGQFIDQLPGFEEKFASLDADMLDQDSRNLLHAMILIVGIDPLLVVLLKTAYVLGAYNEGRGRHGNN